MKLSKKKLGVMVGAALSFGMVGQASADVYGLSSVQINDLHVVFNATLQNAPSFTFETNQDARLNGASDLSDGAANCAGIVGLGNSCNAASPRLSGTVQNAPGSSSIRGENDYTKFGSVGNYSGAEAAIVTAVLLGDPATSTSSISESNIAAATSAQANTNVGSNTLLNLDFTIAEDGGAFSIAFEAIIDVLSKVTGVDVSHGLAQANSGLTVILQKAGQTLASWAPTGNNNVTTCAAGLTCTAVEAALSLNNSTSSSGAANQVAGSGRYSLDVAGLTTGQYTLALASTTSTNLARFPVVPVPGTLFLMGAGLLAGARALRRKA